MSLPKPSHAETFVSSGKKPESRLIVVIGDSLSAEYGLARDTGWVAQIAQRLHAQHTGYQIHNSSISGDTTSGGVNRISDVLKHYEPDIVVLELGSNDALRGLSLEMTQKNLATMITQSQKSGAHVLLAGMQIPPNYGRRYTQQFEQLFTTLAAEYQTALVPFLFDGFATQTEMFQDDGIHPNKDGQTMIADNVWRQLKPLMDALPAH